MPKDTPTRDKLTLSIFNKTKKILCKNCILEIEGFIIDVSKRGCNK